MTINWQTSEEVSPQCVFLDMFDTTMLMFSVVLPLLMFKESLLLLLAKPIRLGISSGIV